MVSDVAIGTFELSDPEFWLAPHNFCEGAFHALRTARSPRVLRRMGLPRLAVPEGSGLLGGSRHEDVWHASRNPQLFISGRGINIADMPVGDGRVLRVDDRDGRPAPLPAALDRGQGLHAQGDHPGRGVREDQGDGDRRPPARAVPRRRVRLRHRDRRAAPAADHLRDDGHPPRTKRRSSAGPTPSSAPATPSSARRSRCSSAGDGDVRVRAAARRGPPGNPRRPRPAS